MESNTELAEKYNALLKEYNQTLKDAIATELKYKEIHTKTKIQEAAIELLAEKHLKLKARCEKMADVFRTIINAPVPGNAFQYMAWFVTAKNIAGGAISEWEAEQFVAEIKEGESNTPAPVQGETKEINMSYTKGQWYLQKYTDAYTNIIRCNNGKHETIYIASTSQNTTPETRANARLMAAAPDLLEALQEVVAISDRNHIAWVKAKAAIEKAIGSDNSNNNPH